jgi:biopolymer transport protein ExbB
MDNVPDIVDAVLIFLLLLSILVWGIGLAKWLVFHRTDRRNQSFLETFGRLAHMRDIQAVLHDESSAFARICKAGMDELFKLQSSPALAPDDRREILLHALKAQSHQEQKRLESGLAVLASIGSTAPFIGLFGTVWGIMLALRNISATRSAGLDVVAGPIGEALIATAIGIATAVPAVLAYNYFLRKSRQASADMSLFASAFQNLIIKSE